MSGELSRHGSGEVVFGAEQNDSSSLVAKRLLGSNAAYLVIFCLSLTGRLLSTLSGPGPTSRIEIQECDSKNGANKRANWGIMKF